MRIWSLSVRYTVLANRTWGRLVVKTCRNDCLPSAVTYQPTLTSVSQFLTQTLRPGDLAFFGAGNLNQVIPEVASIRETSKRGR